MGQVSEKSFPFDAEEVNGNWDREYKAEDFARYFKAFISSGSFLKVASNLQVLANGDMSVTIKPGDMMIEGYRYENTEDIIVNLTAADGTLSRIDRISITWSSADRDIHCTVQEGEFSLNPVAPECRRNADYKDYVIADVFVAAGVVSIMQTDITDQRLNDELCGLATPFVELDTQELYAKLEAFYEEVVVESEEWQRLQEQSFDVWFETIKDQLSGDVAGNLQLQIDSLNERTEELTESSEDLKARVSSLEAGGGADKSTVRYISDEADENFDWIQVQDAEGNWVNSHRAYIARYWFVKDGLNVGNISQTVGNTNANISHEDDLTILSVATSNGTQQYENFVFDEIDFTNYHTLTFEQSSTFFAASSSAYVTFGVKDSLGNVLTYYKFDTYANNSINFTDEVILDVSNIEGKYIPFITLSTYYNHSTSTATATCRLSQVYAE